MEATFHYDEALMLRAARRYWSRKVGWGTWLSLAFFLVAVPVAAASDLPQWIAGALGAVGATGAFVVVYGFVQAKRIARESFRKLDPPRSQIVLAEDGFTVTTNLGTTNLKWSAVSELWREREFTLLFFAEETFTVLPVAGAPPGLHETIAERVRAAGGKVR